jgi:hypothetical protein
MTAVKKAAHWAGFLYLIASIPAPFDLLYIPSRFVVAGDATATADRIRASETVWRLGIGAGLLSQVLFLFVMLALYRLFKDVDAKNARLMAVFGGLVSAPIMFVSEIARLVALTLAKAPPSLSAFTKPQLDALAYVFARFNVQGTTVASIFWGLWLFPFGMLVIRSRFIPRWLGYSLMAAGTGYVASAFFTIVLPQFTSTFGSVAGLLELGELPIIFWLLIWGAREQDSLTPHGPSHGAGFASGSL